jgi:hypothetical protein
MSTDTLALMERLRTSATLDWKSAREEIWGLHKKAETSEERGALLAVYTAVMNLVERSGTVTDIEKFKEAWQSDYNLFLISEATDGQDIVPEKLLAVTAREIAAGRMAETDELHKLALEGHRFIQPASLPSSSWWSRLTCLFRKQ